MGIHHLFNLLTPVLSLFFTSLHCSLWFIQSLPCRSLSLSLGLAHYCSSVDWDSMYPEKVRSPNWPAFDSTVIYLPHVSSLCFPLYLSASNLPGSFPVLAVVCTIMSLIWYWARVGVHVRDLFSK